MQRNRMTALALALALGMVFPAAAGAGERTGVPGGDWADIQSRGRLLHEHQRALLLAEQRAGASATFRSDARPLTAVSEKTGSSEITVTFADATGAALYRVAIDLRRHRPGPLEVFLHPRPANAYVHQAVLAHARAFQVDVDTCGYEVLGIVLPHAHEPGLWQVYLLPRVGRGEAILVGASHRIETDGREVLARRAFADTCVVVDHGPGSVGVMVASAAGESVPTEVHVFWSLWAALPMYVGTDSGLWSIREGAIDPPRAMNASHQAGAAGGAGGLPHAQAAIPSGR